MVAEELPRLSIELSVLTPRELVDDLSAIEVGRDGLIVEQGKRRGLLLPQVATDHGWDRETFLAQTCVKAGLAERRLAAGRHVWRFSAEVFGERDRNRGRGAAVEYARHALAACSASGVLSGPARAVGLTASAALLRVPRIPPSRSCRAAVADPELCARSAATRGARCRVSSTPAT